MTGASMKVSSYDRDINRGGETMTRQIDDKSSWVIGGTTLIGIGVGFIFLHTSSLLFVASILIGIGLGLVITPIISGRKGRILK